MPEPTTAQMIAWCEGRATEQDSLARTAHVAGHKNPQVLREIHQAHARYYRAIAARLRASAGIAHEPPAFEAAPANVTAGNFGRKGDG